MKPYPSGYPNRSALHVMGISTTLFIHIHEKGTSEKIGIVLSA
jgi:hypothetical protein